MIVTNKNLHDFVGTSITFMIMHVEKNVYESIIVTMLHCGKSKDGINACKDLQDMKFRKDLHPQACKTKHTFL